MLGDLANVGGASALDSAFSKCCGGFAFDIKGKSQEDLDLLPILKESPSFD